MADQARYYLSRVLKSGQVKDATIVQAIVDPVQIKQGKFLYTFTNIARDPSGDYVFAHLAKYVPQGEVQIVDPQSHSAAPASVNNQLIARSPFVYIPKFSAVAYQHVWNLLQRDQFELSFAKLILEKHEGFFADCRLEAIVDLITFVQKLSQIDLVTKLDATVRPPNPLFSPNWRSLKSYMQARNVNEVQVSEKAATDDGIGTKIGEFARQALRSTGGVDETQLQQTGEAPSMTDAAILMAADGYGKAKVEGKRGERIVVIRTQESQISFEFAKDPEPRALYENARERLDKINSERHLEHD